MLSWACIKQLRNLTTQWLQQVTTANGHKYTVERRRPSLVVAVTVGHGEDVAVEDAKPNVKGHDGLFALVVLPATFVRL